MNDFQGSKIALIKGDEVLVILRDDKPDISNPGLWDFPGGGREDSETPFECVAREVHEELGITIAESSIIWKKIHPAMSDPSKTAYFMVAPVDDDALANIVFGDEGQGWKMIKITDFLSDPTAIGHLKDRLTDYLASRA